MQEPQFINDKYHFLDRYKINARSFQILEIGQSILDTRGIAYEISDNRPVARHAEHWHGYLPVLTFAHQAKRGAPYYVVATYERRVVDQEVQRAWKDLEQASTLQSHVWWLKEWILDKY